MKLGRNMRAFLTTIQAEPGQWTTVGLAKDYNITPSSARRTLRKLEELHLVWRQRECCGSCAHDVERWYAADQLPGDSSVGTLITS